MFTVLFLGGCSTNKRVAYFKDVSESYDSPQMLARVQASELKIQPDDILQVTIQSIDPELNNIMGANSSTELARTSGGAAVPTAPSDNIPGFRVDKQGDIELPLAGKLHVAGLNTTEVKELVKQKAIKYYKDPVVNVRLANFKVTVLGEVLRPGTYSVANENITLLDAIGMAGDLTIYGKRENVLLIRKENGGQLSYIRFDMNSSNTFKSPYFILHQGDVIYIEPNKSKVASTDVAKLRSYSLIATGISLLIVILSRVNFN
ncbi:MAG: polysaccharide export protein [Flavipsychrobacter sp.]|nr:polysaccharide export protein [Flavipsychrobacter sp.]